MEFLLVHGSANSRHYLNPKYIMRLSPAPWDPSKALIVLSDGSKVHVEESLEECLERLQHTNYGTLSL